MGEAEGFLFAGFGVGADEVPDAVAVEQGVGFEAVVAAFFFSGFGVVEFDFLFGFDGLVQGVKIGLAVFDVFVLEAFYLYALGEVLLVEAAVDLGQQLLDAAKAGKALDVFGVEVAEFAFVEAVIARAAFVPSEEVQPFVEVSLDGAYAGAAFFGQLFDVYPFATVEFLQDANQAVGKIFVFAAHGAVLWWMGMTGIVGRRLARLCRTMRRCRLFLNLPAKLKCKCFSWFCKLFAASDCGFKDDLNFLLYKLMVGFYEVCGVLCKGVLGRE